PTLFRSCGGGHSGRLVHALGGKVELDRGPVDFKFSSGYANKALLAVQKGYIREVLERSREAVDLMRQGQVRRLPSYRKWGWRNLSSRAHRRNCTQSTFTCLLGGPRNVNQRLCRYAFGTHISDARLDEL